MSLQPKHIRFGALIFDVFDNVYEPAEDSFLLAENLTIDEDESVLDVGSGCGLLAVLASQKARKVVATDVNPSAVRCTKHNAVLNNVADKLEVRLGDLFQPMSGNEKFDLILFNAPYLPSEEWEEHDDASRAWAGGETGRKTIDRFVREVPSYLKSSGRVLMVQSSLSNVEKTLQMFFVRGLRATVIAERKVDFETIVVIEAKR